MIEFEEHLRKGGLGYRSSVQFGKVADRYVKWMKENKLTPAKVKRSRFMDFMQLYKDEGICDRTIESKERAIKRYHEFLGTKHNPAKSWLKRKKKHELPPPIIDKEELEGIYQAQKPKSPAEYRDRCMLGLILFQGLLRGELEELRMSDIDFEEGKVFVQGQRRTNTRRLKLESTQLMHLYDYVNKYRKELLVYRTYETDRFFLSKGTSEKMGNSLELLMKRVKKAYPYIEGFRQIRGSVISHWDKEEGVIMAMVKAGHRYVSSTERYQTKKYDELREDLKTMHPFENMNLAQ